MKWKTTLPLFFFFATAAAAQIQLGAKAGASYMNLHLLEYQSVAGSTFAPRPGLQVGVFADKFFDDWMSLRAELLVSYRSVEYTPVALAPRGSNPGDLPTAASAKLNLAMASLPLLLRVRFGGSVILTTGIELDYHLNQPDANFKRPKEAYELGLIGGLGFEFLQDFGLELRYFHGMMPTVEARPPAGSPGGTSCQLGFSRGVQLIVEYRFGREEEMEW